MKLSYATMIPKKGRPANGSPLSNVRGSRLDSPSPNQLKYQYHQGDNKQYMDQVAGSGYETESKGP
jgi:hypothetical protein